MLYSYQAKVLQVIDGDTVKVSLRLAKSRASSRDLGLHVIIENGFICVHESLRLVGVNAPEKNTAAGKESKAWLANELPVGLVIDVVTIKDKTEKYGRYLATMTRRNEKVSINDLLVLSGHAVAWDGKGVRP